MPTQYNYFCVGCAPEAGRAFSAYKNQRGGRPYPDGEGVFGGAEPEIQPGPGRRRQVRYR